MLTYKAVKGYEQLLIITSSLNYYRLSKTIFTYYTRVSLKHNILKINGRVVNSTYLQNQKQIKIPSKEQYTDLAMPKSGATKE